MHGFHRFAAGVPSIRVADVDHNTRRALELIQTANQRSCAALLLPELTLTGYTCADLFNQSTLIEASLAAVSDIVAATRSMSMAVILGNLLPRGNALYNCAWIIHQGSVRGITPKIHIPNHREFYEKRWFKSGRGLGVEEIVVNGERVPFGPNLVFQCADHLAFGVEVCEDLWHVIPPSSHLAIAGATVIFNPSASDELVSKADYRRQLIRQQSARCVAGYVYASAGVHESTTDLVYGGHALVAENGSILVENQRFERENSLVHADVDCQRMTTTRRLETTMPDAELPSDKRFVSVAMGPVNSMDKLERSIDPLPFVPKDEGRRSDRCGEIFSIQASSLAKRLEHTGLRKVVVGVSGGLDSTLALLVAVEAFERLGRNVGDIITVTMPGFGTTDRTKNNAEDLCRQLGTDFRQINISKASLAHFADIGHDPAVHDVTYENVQARERTQVLMDLANKEGGLVLGTGDLSEIALGWSTYNGDHMSMYAVNCGVPKTLIKYLVEWVADHSPKARGKVLKSVIATPITPELLPKGDDGEVAQKTEELIGPYELHDFFLYHTVKYGASPAKILLLAKTAFKKKYSAKALRGHLDVFVKRFFSQQFKRSCVPDGPKVGTISLSPRGDWRMPSDAVATLWKA